MVGGARSLVDPGNRCALRYIALQPTDLADPVGKDPSSLAAQRKDGDRDAPTTWGILHHRSKCPSGKRSLSPALPHSDQRHAKAISKAIPRSEEHTSALQ